MGVFIAGTGFFHPEDRITNSDLERMVPTSDDWIQQYTGIVERRRAPEGWKASDLGLAAMRRALANARWRKDEVDLLVCATSTPDALVPSTACRIANKLGISPPAFDLNAACAGFLFGLGVVVPLVETGRHNRVALVAAENYTRWTDYEDRRSCIFFGDAGACAVFTSEEPDCGFEVVDFETGAITDGAEYVHVPLSGYFWQDGPKVKEYALRGFLGSAKSLLQRNNLEPDDLSAFVGHQANYRLLQAVVDQLGLEERRHWHIVQKFGNQGAAGAPAAFARGVRKQGLNDGDLVLMTVFGGGFTSASALFRYINKAA